MNKKLLNILNKNYSLDTSREIKLLRKGVDNDIYQFFTGEGKRAVARVGKRSLSESIGFEARLINKLVEKGIKTPAIIKTKDNVDYIELSGGKVLICFEFVEGKPVDLSSQTPGDDHIKQAAKNLGELHQATVNLKLDNSKRRTVYSEFNRVNEISEKLSEKFEGAEEFIKDINKMMSEAKAKNYQAGIIHNDFNPTNVLFNNSILTAVVDFDWACEGPLLIDVGHGAATWSTKEKGIEPDRKKFDLFVESYKSKGPIKEFSKEELYFWAGYSCLYLAANFMCDSAVNNKYNIKDVNQSRMYKRYKFYNKIEN